MKRLLFVLVLGISCAGVFSQDSSSKPKADTSLTANQMKNYVVMTGGKMLLIKNDTSTALTTPMVLPNGTSIRTDGSFLVDGHQQMLNEGDRIYLNGKIVRRMKPDSTKKIPRISQSLTHIQRAPYILSAVINCSHLKKESAINKYPFEAGTQLSAAQACTALETFVTDMKNIYQADPVTADVTEPKQNTAQELQKIFSEHLRATKEHFARLEQVFETLARRYKL